MWVSGAAPTLSAEKASLAWSTPCRRRPDSRRKNERSGDLALGWHDARLAMRGGGQPVYNDARIKLTILCPVLLADPAIETWVIA